MCTYNVHGFNEKEGQKMQSLLSWANAKALDVFFIQEHNLGVGRHKMRWRDLCRRFGFCVIHGIHH